MPICLDPEQTFDLPLSNDAATADAERPAFTFRFMATRDWLKMERLMTEADAEETASGRMQKVYDALRVPLVGWQNMRDHTGAPIAYDPADLDLVTSPADAAELAQRVLAEAVAKETELKKSAWQSRANTGASANDASREPA